MRIMLSHIFKNKKKNENIKSSEMRPNDYIKRGPEILNQINLIYDLATEKKNDEYINKLSEILYNCKNVNNYPYKRINLDKAIYKINSKNELYITLPSYLRNFRSNTIESKRSNKNYIFKNNNNLKIDINENCLSSNNLSRNKNKNENISNNITESNIKLFNGKMKTNILETLKKEHDFELYDNKSINANKINNIINFSNNLNVKKSLPIINSNSNLLRSENIHNKKSIKDEISDEIKSITKKAIKLNSFKNNKHPKIFQKPFYIKPIRKNNSMNKKEFINNNEKNQNLYDNGTVLKKMASELISIAKYT